MWAREEFRFECGHPRLSMRPGRCHWQTCLPLPGPHANLILLGDPQQLAQPSHAAHPPGAGVSALEHILGPHATMPDDAGLFLDQTYRMHPTLCSYTSEVFYDGRLRGVDGLEHQALVAEDRDHAGAGLRIVEVPHEGNINSSPEEAVVVVALVQRILGAEWTDKDGVSRPMTSNDVLVVTPYNAQIRDIDRALTRRGVRGVRGRHGRQVSGPRGARGYLFDGDVLGRRGPSWLGISVRSPPVECRNVARQGSMHHRGESRSRAGVLWDAPADAARQCFVSGVGVGHP